MDDELTQVEPQLPKTDSLVAGTQELCKALITQAPQVDSQGKLLYYFAGSLGMNLFLQATHCHVLDHRTTPDLVGVREMDFSTDQRQLLQSVMRQIGDIDIVATSIYEQNTPRDQRLYATQIKFPMTPSMQSVFKKGTTYIDKPSSIADQQARVWKVDIGEGHAYILDPGRMIAYKFSGIRSSGITTLIKKDTVDFIRLFPSLYAVLGKDYLEQNVYEFLMSIAPGSYTIPFAALINIPDSTELLNNVLKKSPDSHFLDRFSQPNENAVNILSLLGKYKGKEIKERLVKLLQNPAINFSKAYNLLTRIDEKSSRSFFQLMEYLLKRSNTTALVDCIYPLFWGGWQMKDPILRDKIIAKIIQDITVLDDKSAEDYLMSLQNNVFNSLPGIEEQQRRLQAYLAVH